MATGLVSASLAGSGGAPGTPVGAYQFNSASTFAGGELTRQSATVTSAGADSATAAAMTFRGQNSRGGTDTDVAGGNLVVASGAGTGAAAVTSLQFQTPTVGSTGSAQQTLATRLTLSSASAAFTVPVSAALGTITADAQCFSGTVAWNNAGVAFTAMKVNAVSTASGAASLLLDLQVSGVSQFSVSKAGVVTAVSTITGSNVFAAAAGTIGWTGRSAMLSPADGSITLTNSAGSAFSLLNFGGATSSFPALKRSSAVLECRLADDSAYAAFTALRYTATQGTITSDAQAFSGTVTWNSGGTTFTAIKLAVTSTASAAASLLMDLQVGGATMFSVDKLGQAKFNGGSATAGNFLQLLYKEETVAVANGVSTQDGTASFIPAGAFIMAFRFKVGTQPGGTASYSAGTSTGTTAYLPAGTSTVGGTTSFGGLGTSVANSFGLWQSASARTMRFTFNASTTNGSGSITYGFWYFLPTVA